MLLLKRNWENRFRREDIYEKKIAALLVCSTMLLAFSITAFAMPANVCRTTISSGNTLAQGYTQCAQATYCSVNLIARYAGGLKTESSSGVVACVASATVSSPYEFITADSSHRIDYYENGYLNTFTTGSGAAASK